MQKQFIISFVVGLISIHNSIAQQPWPAQSWNNAVNLTAAMDVDGIDQLSGLHWNPVNNRLYCVQNNGRLRVLQMNTATNSFTQIGNKSISGGPEGITQANLSANEFYVIDENNYEIQKYTHNNSFSNVTESKHWDLLLAPSPMEDTGNTGPEGIVFIPDANLTAAGFKSSVTGQPYISTKGAGGLFFIAHQDEGYIWVYDINPNVNNDFAYVGKYATAHPESCDLAFDRSTGLLYILHNIDENYLEVTNLALAAAPGSLATFQTVNDYKLAVAGDGNENIEGFALMPKCGSTISGSAWLCRDASGGDGDSILQSTLKWFNTFAAAGNCVPLATDIFETSNVNVYPNPFENRITVSGLTESNATVQIYNGLGQLVGEQKSQNATDFTFDVNALASGIYFLQVNENGNTQTFKLFKKK